MDSNRRRNGVLAIIGAAICFGTTGTAQQLGARGISPLAIGSTRLASGSLLLFLLAHLTRRNRSMLRMPRNDLLISALGVATYQLAFFSAVHLTGVAIATVTALGSAPTLTAIVAFVVVKERPKKSWFIGTVLTVIGIMFVGSAHGFSSLKPTGLLLAVLAGFGFAVFNVINKRSLSYGVQDIWLMATSFGVAALIVSPFIFVQNPKWILTSHGASTVLWLGLVTTTVGYALYAFGLHRVPSSTAATLALAEPATATILAATILGESLTLRSYLGVFIVGVGLMYLGMASN